MKNDRRVDMVTYRGRNLCGLYYCRGAQDCKQTSPHRKNPYIVFYCACTACGHSFTDEWFQQTTHNYMARLNETLQRDAFYRAERLFFQILVVHRIIGLEHSTTPLLPGTSYLAAIRSALDSQRRGMIETGFRPTPGWTPPEIP